MTNFSWIRWLYQMYLQESFHRNTVLQKKCFILKKPISTLIVRYVNDFSNLVDVKKDENFCNNRNKILTKTGFLEQYKSIKLLLKLANNQKDWISKKYTEKNNDNC